LHESSEEAMPLGKLEFTHHIYEEYQPIFPRESKPPIILQSVPHYSVANFFTVNKQQQQQPHPSPQLAATSQEGNHHDVFHHQQVSLDLINENESNVKYFEISPENKILFLTLSDQVRDTHDGFGGGFFRPPALLPPHQGGGSLPRHSQFNFGQSSDPSQRVYYGDFGSNRNPAYQTQDPQPNPSYNGDPHLSAQYQQHQASDYQLSPAYYPLPQYSPTNQGHGYQSPQAIVYEPKEDPYSPFPVAQPLLKYHLIHQSYPSSPIKLGDRDDLALLSSPAASPSSSHGGAIIPAFLPGKLQLYS
jgi:hypothetical protein